MFDPKEFEAIVQKLYSVLPASLQDFENDIQQKFKEILHTAFAHLDLVTREEFDVQLKVLARTREKVDVLQQQINNLLKNNSHNTEDEF